MNKARLFLVGFLLASLYGCSTLASLLTPTAQPFEQAIVYAAVGASIQQGTADRATWAARATKIKAIAQQLQAIDTGSSAALALLEQVLNAKIISLNLPPADLLAAQTLTAAIEAVIQTELGSASNGVLTPQSQVAINDVLLWVTTAASAYGA